jgi:hypothetical protein
MRCRRVSLVTFEPESGISVRHRFHQPVPENLRNNRSRADCTHLAVTSDNGLNCTTWFRGQPRATISVNPDMIRSDMQTQHRPVHGQHGCIENIECINFSRITPGYGPAERAAANLFRQGGPARSTQAFGIIETQRDRQRLQYDRSRNYRTGQRSPTDFIDTRTTARSEKGQRRV